MICERHMKKKHTKKKKHRRHMDKDMYIYKYEESGFPCALRHSKTVYISNAKRIESTTGVVDCVCFQEERATHLRT
jgi:hypothetical protein